MAENKNSFVLYCEIIHTVKKLSNEKAGELFKHILSYVNDENPVTDDVIIELVFEPIKQQLKRSLVKWEATREKRSIAGLASAEARRISSQNQQVSTHVETNEQVSTNSTVSVPVPVPVSVPVIEDISNVNFPKKENSQEGDFLKSLSLKYKISMAVIGIAQAKFEAFRLAYPGKKDGSDVSFQYYLESGNSVHDISLLLPALEKEKVYMAGKTINWKNLKTWIHDKCWLQELPVVINTSIPQRTYTYNEVMNKGACGVKDIFDRFVKIDKDKYIEKSTIKQN